MHAPEIPASAIITHGHLNLRVYNDHIIGSCVIIKGMHVEVKLSLEVEEFVSESRPAIVFHRAALEVDVHATLHYFPGASNRIEDVAVWCE